MIVKAIFLLAVPAVCFGFIFRDQTKWNGLKVTWGINPFTSFQSVPRTKTEALSHGWTNMDPGTGCSDSPHFLGERYTKDGDMAAILIFDPAGYIAGMQAGIRKDYPNNPNDYPFNPLKNNPFVLVGDYYYVTAYFVDPATLCKGRTASAFLNEGTGNGLWIQNGTHPVANSEKMPMTKTAADSTMWTEGACFATMGLHYWYNLKIDMSCNNLFPVFLLYNEGKLNAFGWAFGMDLEGYSKRVEHPPESSYGTFMKPVPHCLGTLGTMTTMHIYLTDSATADLC